MPRTVGMLAGALLLVTACGGGDGAAVGDAGERRIQVIASFYPLFEAVEQVGGDRVEVTNLTPPGTEPHDLELNPRQVDLIEEADVVFYLGQGFQPGVDEVAGRIPGRAVDLLEGLPLVEGFGDDHDDDLEDDHGEEGIDPHVWLDPRLMHGIVGRVADTLTAVDPEGGTAYAARAEAYRAGLEALDEQYRTRLERCERRTVITAHAAFGYLTRRYGLTQEAITGLSPEAEPDPRRLGELADLVTETGSTTVFYETLTSPRIAETLARETGARTAVLNPLEGLTDEELAAGKGYVSVMEDNLDALVAALGCT